MPRSISHVSDKKNARTYSGEAIGRNVVGWLNFHRYPENTLREVRGLFGKRFNSRDQQNRVIDILRLYQQSRTDWENRIRQGTKNAIESSAKGQSAFQKLKRRLRV